MTKAPLLAAGSIGTLLVLSLLLAGCESCAVNDTSYMMPSEWIGVTFESEQDANDVRSALAGFAKAQQLSTYRPMDQPFFAEQNRKDPSSHYERYTYYSTPGRCTGWQIVQVDYSPECMVVQIVDRSGVWAPEALEAVRRVERVLAGAARGKVAVLVRAKPEQRYPAQLSIPEVDLPPSDKAPCEWRTSSRLPRTAP